jgi:DnaJ-class molecular chaperone
VDESLAQNGGTMEYTFYRQEPCGRCWGEGCDACQKRGHMQAKIKLPVKVRPGLDQILIEKQGAAAEPGGPRGDLILYVVVE